MDRSAKTRSAKPNFRNFCEWTEIAIRPFFAVMAGLSIFMAVFWLSRKTAGKVFLAKNFIGLPNKSIGLLSDKYASR